MAPVLFKDVSKKANDLLKRDFVCNHEFEIKNTTTTGLQFTTTGKRQGTGFDLDFEVEYNDKAAGVKVKEKLENSKDMALEVSVANKLVDGLKVGVVSTTNTGKPKSIHATLEYQNKSSVSTVDVDLEKFNVEASTVVAYENFLVGAKTQFDASKGSVTGADVVASYSGKDVTVTAGVNSTKQEVNGTYVYSLSNLNATLVGSYNLNTANSASTFAVGGAYKCDNGGVVKAKIESTGRLHMVYTQKMNDNLTLALGTNINTSKLGESNSQDVGVSLKYSA